MRRNLDNFLYWQPVKALDDAIGDQSYPASGSFIDVSEYTHFGFLIHAGDNWGTPVFTVQAASAADGSLTTVSGATITGLASDDDKWMSIEVEVAKLLALSADHHFVTLTVSASAAEEAEIIFVAWNARREPVTQHANRRTAVVVAG